jgi:YD repeat-containing protein
MIRHFPLLIGVSMLSACGAAPLALPISTTVSSVDIPQSIDQEVRAIDSALTTCYCAETKRDTSSNETATAYRQDGTAKKLVVEQNSDQEASKAEYYFTAEGSLLFARKAGARMERDASGHLTTVTNPGAMYYFEDGALVTVVGALGQPRKATSAEEQEVKADAAEAATRFER